jgi:glutathione S-transferase
MLAFVIVTVVTILSTLKTGTTMTTNTKPSSIKLTYFDIEGAAEPTRLALTLSGTPFEDVRVKFPDWAALKPTTPYGQLPLFQVDNDPVRTQSMAMLRWVGTTLSDTLYPADKLLDVEEALGVVEDMEKSWQPAFYMGMRPANFGRPDGFQNTDEGKAVVQEMREQWIQTKLSVHVEYLENLLKKNNGKWLASTDAPTIADCKAIVFLRALTRGHVDFVPADCLDKHAVIVDYIKRFCALELIKGRYTSGIC